MSFLAEEKPHMTHVVLTGCNARDELKKIADFETKLEPVKHPVRARIRAQIGV